MLKFIEFWLLTVILGFQAVSVKSVLVSSKYFQMLSVDNLKVEVPVDQMVEAQVEKYFFTQILDHFNSSDRRTWKQRYYINRQFYIDGGPVFLYISAEIAADPSTLLVSQTSWSEYAKRLNAMIFLLEHRFYGDSHPTKDASTQNFKYLTITQVLADLASFTQGMQIKYNLMKNKWISFGRSYGGILSTWYRLKYPNLVYAAVASSAPVEITVDYKDYFRVVRNKLGAEGSINCIVKIKEATYLMKRYMKSGNSVKQTTLKNLFRLCKAQNLSNPIDVYSLYLAVANNIAHIVQYNEDFGGSVNANISISTICDIMTDVTDGNSSPFLRYAAVYDLIEMKLNKHNCTDQREDTIVSDLRNTTWDSPTLKYSERQWLYQTCSQFGFFSTSNTDQIDIFGKFPLTYFIKICQKVFGKHFNLNSLERNVRETNEEYGGKSPKVRRVIFINGSIDPYHPLGITNNYTLPHGGDNLVIFIYGTAHCAEVYGSTPKDLPQLRRARTEIFTQLSKWVS